MRYGGKVSSLFQKGQAVKKAKVLAGSVVMKEVKKKDVESWADWSLANLRVLSTCPNERLLVEYLEYMIGRVKLQRRGFKWVRFKVFDEEFRRHCWVKVKHWNEFYGDLWCDVTVLCYYYSNKRFV